jgi:hypothetical protein
VTCRDMDCVISSRSGNWELEPQQAEHLIHCAGCRGLTHLLDEVSVTLRPAEGLLHQITGGILDDLKPIRPLAPSHILLFACVIIFLSVVACGALLVGLKGWSALSLVQRVIVFSTLAASTLLLAISLVRQIVPGSKHVFAPSVLLAGTLAALIIVIVATFRLQKESAFLASGVMCMKSGFAYSIAEASLVWLVLRRGAVLYPKIVAAVAGGLAGLAGLSVLELNCPNLNVLHILVWHGGVAAIGSLGGGALMGAAAESIQQ